MYNFVKSILDNKMLCFESELDNDEYFTYPLNKAIENNELFKVDI